MRITGGTAAGIILKVPKGYDVRPTPDLVKQAVFNSLGERVLGARVLELFSGTGAMGFECLSRGAVHLVAVEKSPRHAEFIRKNLAAARFPEEMLELRVQDVYTVLQQFAVAERRFDLILADPPYGEKNVGRRSTSHAQQLLDLPGLPGLLNENGLLVLGHSKRDTLALPGHWWEHKVLKHGDSIMRFLKQPRVPEPDVPNPS
jgi:16S rRNA (guanine966-N2)-methyltransferase